MYFKNFQKIYYDYNINGEKELKVVTDITKNVRFRKEVLSNISAYDYYDIKDGETPEIIAEKIYGNPEYHWIIMLANDKYDYLSDFPLSTHELEKFINEKYDDQLYAIHHYENGKGLVVDSSYPGAVSVSNYDYETRINESKRKIKIVSKDIINLILTNLSNL